MKRQGLLDLNEAVQHPGRRLEFDVDTGLLGAEDLDLVNPVNGTLEAKSTGNILLIKGHFEAECTMECARCGEPINQKVNFKMSDEFQVEGIPAGYGSGDFAVVVEEEDYPLFNKNAINVDDYVRQGLIVNLPSQPLCEFGWEGDCPNARGISKKAQEEGHPAMQKLKTMITPEDE